LIIINPNILLRPFFYLWYYIWRY